MSRAELFPRSYRSLSNEAIWRWVLRLLVIGLFLALWITWFFTAEIPLFELSSAARLEVVGAMYPLQAPVTGRLTALTVEPGQEVGAGELLAELDPHQQRLQLNEEQARLAAVAGQLPALQQQLAAAQAAAGQLEQGEQAALDEARARLREAEAAAALAHGELARQEQLHDAGTLSQIEWQRAETRWQRRQAEAEAAAHALARGRARWQARRHQQAAELAELQQQRSELEGQHRAGALEIRRLRYELTLFQLRAPVAGTIAEVADVPIGALVAASDTLATLAPAGRLKVVAELSPIRALGRIRRGQPAELRLLGFPWVEFGTVSATVTAVAGEARNGRLRVELELNQEQDCAVTLQHGMPGTVQIEVERVSPAELVLRVAGRHSRPARQPAQPADEEQG